VISSVIAMARRLREGRHEARHHQARPMTTIDSFEDDLTRELPSALRTFTDLEPISEIAAEDLLELSEHTVRIARPPSLPPVALDIVLPTAAAAAPMMRAMDVRLVLAAGAALVLVCALACTAGIVAGRKLPGAARATRAMQAEARQPRTASFMAAREVITFSPPTATAKLEPPPPPAPTPPRPPPPVARTAIVHTPPPPPPPSGRGHLGSDRNPSPTPGTRPRR
jgi:hypothetical protein